MSEDALLVEESHDLLLGLASDLSDDVPDLDIDALLDVPVVYASGRNGAASWNKPENGSLPELHKTGTFGSRSVERIAFLRRSSADTPELTVGGLLAPAAGGP